VLKSYGAVALSLLLIACGAPQSRVSPPPAGIAPVSPPGGPGAVYHIDSARSELRILVYRAGPFAPLGHNHVIVNRALSGWVSYAGEASKAGFSLNVPAAGFIIDDAAARREEGADFAEDISDDAKAGTLRNMLSGALLDAAQFPSITVQSSKVAGTRGTLEATVLISVAGHESTLVVPFSADITAQRLTASGAINLRQSALGLAPFSVLMGGLRVQDEMQVKFKFVAVAAQNPRDRS
jgi:hypothetical protein